MSARYAPDLEAQQSYPWNVTALSQRNVALQVPINFVTVPSISVTAACFGNHVYEADATARCLSNLLSIGFTRLIVDLYWDETRSIWSLCPVQLPNTEAYRLTASVTSSGTSSLAQATIRPPSSESSFEIRARQASSTHLGVTATLTAIPSTRLEVGSSSTLNATLFSQPTSAPVVEYWYAMDGLTCSSTVDLGLITTLLTDYLSQTDFALNAALKYLVFNIHAAQSTGISNGSAEAPTQSSLSSISNLLGNIFTSSLSSYMYTPNLLGSQRANLNTSWQSSEILATVKPISAFYKNETLPNGVMTSPDGWPSESFMEFANERRLVLQYGTIEPQMLSEYDVDADAGLVFMKGAVDETVEIGFDSDGSVTKGCFFDSHDHTLSAANSSWAVGVQIVGLNSLQQRNATAPTTGSYAISNITSCGISPLLNSTLFNKTADMDVIPYKQFVYNSFWSWAPGQPKQDSNASSSDLFSISDRDTNDKDFRCALFNASNGGRWETTFCQNRLAAACRARGSPYMWTIAKERGSYGSVTKTCPDNYLFAVPRNALENRYLLDTVHQTRDSDGRSSDAVWIDFNSLDAESCWVTGVNTTCPYSSPHDQNKGEIVVPIIAAFIIIFVALATVLVKCGSNRSKSKRRRKVRDGWDYEGVPS